MLPGKVQGCSGREGRKGAGMLQEERGNGAGMLGEGGGKRSGDARGGKERGCSGRDAHHHLAAARRQSAAPPDPPSTQKLVLLPLGRFCAWQRQIKTIKRVLSPAAELPGSPLVKGRRAASSGQCQHLSVIRSQGFFLALEKRIQSVKTSPKSSSLFHESTSASEPFIVTSPCSSAETHCQGKKVTRCWKSRHQISSAAAGWAGGSH